MPPPPAGNDPRDDRSRRSVTPGGHRYGTDRSGHPTGRRRPAVDEATELNPVLGPADPPAGRTGPAPAPVAGPASLAVAGLAALLTAWLVLGSMIADGWYVVVIFGVQALFALALTTTARPPAPRVVAGVGLAAALAADLAAVWVDPASLAPLAYVTAGAFVAGVVGQLTRPAGRVRVTESLGSTLVVVVGVVALSTLVVLRRQPLGTQSIAACLLAAGVAVTVARLVDAVAPVPRLAPQVPRGGLGVLSGVLVGTGAAALAGALVDSPATGQAATAGLVTALVAVVADLSTGYADAGREPAGEAPGRWSAGRLQGPLAALALAAPVAFVASSLLLTNHP